VEFVLGVLWRRHADALRDVQAVRRAERIGLVLLRLEAVDISVVQHASLCSIVHVLVRHRLVVVVLGVLRRRHADAFGDV